MHACRLVELHADTKFKLLPCEADPCVIKSEGVQNTFWGQDDIIVIQLIYFLAATGKDIDLLFHRGQELVTRSLQNMPILVFLKLSRIYLTPKKIWSEYSNGLQIQDFYLFSRSYKMKDDFILWLFNSRLIFLYIPTWNTK